MSRRTFLPAGKQDTCGGERRQARQDDKWQKIASLRSAISKARVTVGCVSGSDYTPRSAAFRRFAATSGFTQARSGSPLRPAIKLSAAISAMALRLLTVALAMCGA